MGFRKLPSGSGSGPGPGPAGGTGGQPSSGAGPGSTPEELEETLRQDGVEPAEPHIVTVVPEVSKENPGTTE